MFDTETKIDYKGDMYAVRWALMVCPVIGTSTRGYFPWEYYEFYGKNRFRILCVVDQSENIEDILPRAWGIGRWLELYGEGTKFDMYAVRWIPTTPHLWELFSQGVMDSELATTLGIFEILRVDKLSAALLPITSVLDTELRLGHKPPEGGWICF